MQIVDSEHWNEMRLRGENRRVAPFANCLRSTRCMCVCVHENEWQMSGVHMFQ